MDHTFADIEPAFIQAMDEGKIKAHYQPQFVKDGSAIAGVEALVRWEQPDGSIAGPGSFMPEIEKNPDLLRLLGNYMLQQACTAALQWKDIKVGLNVNPVQFGEEDFSATVENILRETGLPACRLELEILETSWFQDPETAVRTLQHLRDQGISIALDDFGTGYSSLAVLMQLPLDKLKIDRSFITKSSEIKSASIVMAIVALARAIGLHVTAEGVETEAQQRFVRTAGCHYIQGYYYSKPVPAEEITKMLKTIPTFRTGYQLLQQSA